MPTKTYLVFSQQRDLTPDEAALARNARAFAGASLTFADLSFGGEGSRAYGRLRAVLTLLNDTTEVVFQVRMRFSSSADYEAATRAETAGRAAGMAGLAKRCPVVYEVDAEGHTEADVLRLCAVLASVFLGPILPPDESTLMGVRSARLRVEALTRVL